MEKVDRRETLSFLRFVSLFLRFAIRFFLSLFLNINLMINRPGGEGEEK